MIQALALGLIGAGLGKRAYDEYNDYQMQSELGDLMNRKLEPLPEGTPTEPLAEGLKPPTAAGKYQYGNRTLDFAPPQEYLSAVDAMDLAAVYAKYNQDPAKAMELRIKAQDQLAKSYESMARRAVASKSPKAMVQAYNLTPNGYGARLEEGENGNLRVLHYPNGSPDQARELFSGTADALLEWGANNISPELMQTLAKESMARRLQEAQITNWEENRDINRNYKQQQIDAKEQGQLLQQARYWEDVANKATSEGEYVRAMQERDTVIRALAGIGGGGLSSGGGTQNLGSAQGLSKNTTQWRPVVEDATRNLRYVTPDLALAVIQQESKGNATAVSPAGAIGLMQLMPGTTRDLGVSNPYDPVANIRGGVRYLDDLIARYDGDVQKGLMAYNWGMGNVDKHLAGQITDVPRETQNYVPGVMSRFGGAPQPGTSNTPAQPTSGGSDYGAQFRARQEAARMPKPGNEMSVKDRLEAIAAARGLLSENPNFTKLPFQDQLREAEKYAFGTSGAGYDAVGSMGQIANGTAKDNAGGLTGQDFSAFATATAAAAREEESKAASAKDQARFDHMVSTWAAGYKQQWFRDEKTRNPAYALDEARKAIAQIETLYPSLSAKGKKSAELALRGFWKTFPELMPLEIDP